MLNSPADADYGPNAMWSIASIGGMSRIGFSWDHWGDVGRTSGSAWPALVHADEKSMLCSC